MPKQFDQSIKELAKTRWEGGYKPNEVLDALLVDGGVVVTDKTLRRWAKAGRWRDWKLERRRIAERLNPNLPFGVSQIRDPMLHLAWVIARRSVREDSRTRSGRTDMIAKSALEDVQWALEPGPFILQYLKPLIMDYVRDWRKGPMINYPGPIDPKSEAFFSSIDKEIVGESR